MADALEENWIREDDIFEDAPSSLPVEDSPSKPKEEDQAGVGGKKRKRSNTAGTNNEAKRKRGSSNQATDYKRTESTKYLDLPPSLQCDTVTRAQNKAMSGASNLEMAALRLSENFFLDTTSLQNENREISHCLTKMFPKLRNDIGKTKANGSPHVIVVGLAAMRVADLARQIRPLLSNSKGPRIAKLFAKEKLQDQVNFLRTTKVGVACATPNRLAKVLGEDALDLSNLRLFVLDGSHQDLKGKTLLDAPEAKDLFTSVLTHSRLMKRLHDHDMHILLY